MDISNRKVVLGSGVLVGIGILSLVISVVSGWSVNLSLPFVMIVLGAALIILVDVLSKHTHWADLLYLPGCMLAALGLVILLNVITNDWNSWAYAWLLLIAGLGMGVYLLNRNGRWRREVSIAGFVMIITGVTLFALFGAIAGGLFMQVTAPVILVAGGILLYWMHIKKLLPDNLFMIPRSKPIVASSVEQESTQLDQSKLIEPLSARELEVLSLIEQGLSNSEIATRLTLAPSTIKTHINNIYGKLGVQTRIQAIRQMKELGLLRR